MSRLQRLLSLGHAYATTEQLSRHIRIANAIALIGTMLAVASLPFDLLTGGPPWFLLWDLVGMVGFASCWVLNAKGHVTASRVTMFLAANFVFGFSTMMLGSHSRQDVVFFTLAILPSLVFDLAETRLLAAMIVVPVVGYFVTEAVGPLGRAPYSVAAYRVYSPVLAFVGLVAGSLVSARVNRNAEAALHEARVRAVASARMAALGEMASGIAHEIRNPLTSISLATEQLATCTSLDDVGKLQDRMTRMTGRIAKIIDALSSFARDASADPFVEAPVWTIVGETLELCQRRFQVHAITLTVPEIPPSVVIECRPVQISQVLLNMLNNAHDAVEGLAERWVRVEYRVDGDRLELAVVDSGRGIPLEQRAHIFEPFFTTKRPGRGTGLGLSLSRGIVEAHRGTLELDGEAPNTRFVMRLPLRQARG